MKELTKGLVQTIRSPKSGLRLPVIRQFMKFSLVGLVNTFVSITIYELMKSLFHLQPLSANAVAFIGGVTMSYGLNKRWTFRNSSGRHRDLYTKFFLINIVGLILSESIIYLVHVVLGLHDRIGFAAAVAIVVFWNFNANRTWTFNISDDIAKNGKN